MINFIRYLGFNYYMILKLFLIFLIMLTSLILFDQTSYGGTALSVEKNSSNRIFITSENGGECSDIGNWIEHSKTCMLTQNVDKYVRIHGSGITLDGNGYSIQLKQDKEKTTMVIGVVGNNNIIKNIFVKGTDGQLRAGILHQGNNNTVEHSKFTKLNTAIRGGNLIQDNEFHSNNWGVNCGCTVVNNVFTENQLGMNLEGSKVHNNIFKNNKLGFKISYGGNVITNNVLDGNVRPFEWIRQINAKIENNSFLNFRSPPLGEGIVKNNYWDTFDSAREGCIILPSSNFCQSEFSTPGNLVDSSPWKIVGGWNYSIDVPENIQITSEDPEGKHVNFAVSGMGPNGAVNVTCNPSTNNIFPIGQTQVICSIPNGFVSSFFVTVLDQKIVEQKQFEESTKSSSIGLLKILSLGLGIFVMILVFRMRKRKNKFKEKYTSQQNYQSQSYSYKQPNEKSYSYKKSYAYEESEDNYSESNYESDQSTSNSSTDFDSRNLSKEEAFQILEVMETSTRQEIKNSRNRLINQWHPDKHRTPLYRETAEKNTKLIISAYELLRELGYAD